MRKVISLFWLVACIATPSWAEFSAPSSGTGKWVRQIALGRFEIARGATRNESEVIAAQTRRLKLLAAIYHDVYDGMCPITGPSRTFTQRIDTVTRKTITGIETDRQTGTPQSITVRQEYVDVFSEGWALASRPAELVLTMGANVTQQFTELAVVSRDVIRANGCGSTDLELFERNLAAIVRREQSLQRQGKATTLLETRCRETGFAGMEGRVAGAIETACACVAKEFWQNLPEEWLATVEDRFSREELLFGAALTPETWKGVQSCVR